MFKLLRQLRYLLYGNLCELCVRTDCTTRSVPGDHTQMTICSELKK